MIIGFGLSSLSLTAGEAAKAGEARIPSKEKWSRVTIEATVVGVDQSAMEVTLRDDKGAMVTLPVDNHTGRFYEVSIGDKVSAAYLTMIRAEFREPTPAELANPLLVISEGDKSAKTEDPEVLLGTMVRAVVTIMSINLEDKLVTVLTPTGKFMTLPAEDPEVLAQRKVGEMVILTFAEASTISLEKIDN